MREFLAILVSFATIPVLSRRKVSLGISLIICAFVLSLLSGLGVFTYFEAAYQTLTDVARVQQYIVVLEISILGALLKKYNFIDKIVDSLTKVVKNIRIIIMFIPALIGFLVVPGGAIISAPFIDKIGDDYSIPKTNRGIMNLIFRHIAMLMMPYSNGLLITALLVPQISIYKVIGLNLVFIAIYIFLGYMLQMRKVEMVEIKSDEPVSTNLIKLIKYTSPIYIVVFLNLLFNIPFYIGMLANFLAVYLLHPTKDFFKDIVESINIKIILSIVGVYLVQNVISRLGYLNTYLTSVFSNTDTLVIGIILSSIFFGLTTGISYSSLGVILPILAQLPISENRLLLLTHYAFIWGFVSYMFSPLHLCQIFTCEFFEIEQAALYKEYRKFILALVLVALLMYFFWLPILG
ncbi:MAG: DUF401 family protein [Tissierellaceae bacterium]|jgi:integral membrane protein (TIGR00529 family)